MHVPDGGALSKDGTAVCAQLCKPQHLSSCRLTWGLKVLCVMLRPTVTQPSRMLRSSPNSSSRRLQRSSSAPMHASQPGPAAAAPCTVHMRNTKSKLRNIQRLAQTSCVCCSPQATAAAGLRHQPKPYINCNLEGRPMRCNPADIGATVSASSGQVLAECAVSRNRWASHALVSSA